jgi:hypothetical protein
MQVRVVEPTGHESIVTFDVSGERMVARVSASIPLRSGDTLRLTLRTGRAHLFDRSTEESLLADARDLDERVVDVTVPCSPTPRPGVEEEPAAGQAPDGRTD